VGVINLWVSETVRRGFGGLTPQQVVARTLHAPAPIKMRSPAERVLTSGDIFDGYIRKDKRLSGARVLLRACSIRGGVS
jgi:hypothetical protein